MNKMSLHSRTNFLIRFIFGCTLLFSCDYSKKVEQPTAGEQWTVSLEKKPIDMVWINSGSFAMGSPTTEQFRGEDEVQHNVTLSSGYWMGSTEVTVGQWQSVMGTNLRQHVARMLANDTLYAFGEEMLTIREYMYMDPTPYPEIYLANENAELPMYYVSWYDAMSFCKTLTALARENGSIGEEYEYTLPTEAQWEYACRAGTPTSSYIGEVAQDAAGYAEVLEDIAWYGSTSFKNYHGKKLGNNTAGPRDVQRKKPNAFGLYDMSGNLWEWCSDWYGAYPDQATTDPLGLEEGVNKVNRGGSWGSWASEQRSADRAQNPPAEASAYRGFRIVLVNR